MANIRIENWSVRRDPYQPPGTGSRLAGNMYGHPGAKDGTFGLSSIIASTNREARTVTTESGRTYTLGEVDPGYLAFCVGLGFEDPFPRINASKMPRV